MTGDFRNKKFTIDEILYNATRYNNQEFILYKGILSGVIRGNKGNCYATYNSNKTPNFLTLKVPEYTKNNNKIYSLLASISEKTRTNEQPNLLNLKKGQIIFIPENTKTRNQLNPNYEKVTIIEPKPDKDQEIHVQLNNGHYAFIPVSQFDNIQTPTSIIQYQGQFFKEQDEGEYIFLLKNIILENKTINIKQSKKK